MLGAIIIILVVLWFLGYAPISALAIPNITLFTINNHPITLWSVLILFVVGWAISILPRPLQGVAAVLLILWILSVLGILAIIPALPSIIVVVIIIALLLALLGVV